MNAYILRLGRALNRAIELSFPARPEKGNKAPRDRGPPQFVAFIVPCKGVPFYGYSVGYRTYLKVYAVDPKYKKRMAEILRSGALLETQFGVFEDHISFLLQFMLDQNLYGCGWVEVGECLFRQPIPGESHARLDFAGDADLLTSPRVRALTNRRVRPTIVHRTVLGPRLQQPHRARSPDPLVRRAREGVALPARD